MDMESIEKLLELMRTWTSLEHPRASTSFLVVYTALAHLDDGNCFSEIPYLQITGPRDSKKTQAAAFSIDLVGPDRTVFVTAGTTAPVLFRLIHGRQAKLVAVDEADEITSAVAREVARIARTGYRPGAEVYRCDGPTGTKSYQVYGPKLFVRILPERDEALRDRIIELRTLASRERSFRFTKAERDEAIAAVRPLLEQFGRSERDAVARLYGDPSLVPPGLYGRLASIARPLIAVARRMDACWPGFHFERAVVARIRVEWERRRGMADFEPRRVTKTYLRMFLEASPEPAEAPDVFTRRALQLFFAEQDPNFRRMPAHIFARSLYESNLAVGLHTRKRVNGSNPLKHVRLNLAEIRRDDRHVTEVAL